MTTAIPHPRTPQSDTDRPRAWLTRLVLNSAHRTVHADLGNSAALHRRVMSLVPDGLGDSPRAAAGVLFRLEADQPGAPLLLVQTGMAPDIGRLPVGYANSHTRDMAPMLGALRPGLAVRYRLLGNTVRRCGPNSTAGSWKKAIPLRDEDAAHWWTQRASGCGLGLHTLALRPAAPLTAHRRDGDPLQTSAPKADSATTHRQRAKVRVPYAATLFEGTATVQDPELLTAALLTGVGRGKSYGFGLLSLAPERH